ncbi:MAG: DUF3363 domain-containing protein [Alphaproteobacteria bacterium]|nr:DUF3363 domain-containing protein [Alphaproteobacteria bacterium]
MSEDDFRPRLGKTPSRDPGKRYAYQLRAAINRAGGRSSRKGGFTGKRIGRGGPAVAQIMHRDHLAAYRQRRVVVKARIVKLAGKGIDGAAAHLRYIQRDGVTREGERGSLYNAEHDRTDGKSFLEKATKDRHQFRFIVTAEDAQEYDDLKPLTRRLMEQMEKDLDTRLDWVAVDHFNTGHPHTHILLRGKDDQGKDLIIARNYISHGIRERAAELVSLDLGPRTELEIEERLRAETTAESLTSLDRNLLRQQSEGDGTIVPHGKTAGMQTLLTGRLRYLERLGLAEPVRGGGWHLEPGLENTLRRMGERVDIIKTMHRALKNKDLVRSPGDYVIEDLANTGAKPLTGRVIERGLADELNDRHYLIVDATDGRTHYIDIGPGEAVPPTPPGSIVRVTPNSIEARKSDRTVAEIAAANDGRYSIDLHLKHDPTATQNYAEAHIRRLEAMRRAGSPLTREPDGTWIVPENHIENAASYEREQARARPVSVETLSTLPLDRQVSTIGATWLDRELVSNNPEPMRGSGFGREVEEAISRRRQWLVNEGLAQTDGEGRFVPHGNMLATLQRRELARIAGQLSEDLKLSYTQALPGDPVKGTLIRTIDLASGKAALIERSRDFTLVPWRSALERHLGKSVSGLMRTDGTISWTVGRQRGVGIE